jgi:hypothetical protein
MDQLTAAEHAANIAAVEARLPVPMRNPDGVTRLVSPHHVQARLDDGWTR